jgi:hypothetical protein
VDERVEQLFAAHLVREQVREPAGGVEALALVLECEARVQEGVVAEPVGDELLAPGEAAEDLRIRLEADLGAIAIVALAGLVLDEAAACEGGAAELALASWSP